MPTPPHPALRRLAALFVLLTGSVPGLANELPSADDLVFNDLGGHAAPIAAAPSLTHPNLARGVAHGASFEQDPWSSINRFNGNLVLETGIGRAYPLDPLASYQLRLAYNSNVWDLDSSSGEWLAKRANTNAGLGFDLGFGRLMSPSSPGNPTSRWVYVAQDGTAHPFHSDLHWNTPDTADPADLVRYSRDGSSLRMQEKASGARIVEFADGTVQRFTAAPSGEWRISAIWRAGSPRVAEVSYASDGSWTITDSHGRSQLVTLIDDPATPGGRLVAKVSLEAFGGERADYSFSYTTAEIPRPCADPRGGTVTVSLLTSVLDPGGRLRRFEYLGAGGGCQAAGRLAKVDLESGGSLRYSYGEYVFPPAACSGPSVPLLDRNVGIVGKEALLPNGSVEAAWQLTQTLGDATTDPCARQTSSTEVLAPSGDRTRHYFSIATQQGIGGGPAEYGMPITRQAPDASGGRFLSTEVYDCDATGASCSLLRSTFLALGQDRACAVLSDECWTTNRRLTSRRVVYHDDPTAAGEERFAVTDFAGYDGLGNHRTTTESGNFGRGDWFRTTRRTNGDRGGYPPIPNDASGGFRVPASDRTWSLDDVAERSLVDETGAQRHEERCHDEHGRMVRSRQLVGAVPSPRDTVRAWTWQDGALVREELHGGDLDLLPDGDDLCTLELGNPEYTILYTYQHGVLASQEFLEPDGTPVGFRTVDRDIDRGSGLVSASRTIDGIETSYLHDRLGRVTWIRPEAGHGAWTEYAYRSATGSSSWSGGERTTTYLRSNGGGSALRKEVEWRDHFGWKAGSQLDLPEGILSLVREDHDVLGLLTATSTAHRPGETVHWTRTIDVDPFGRPRVVRPPEGSQHDRQTSYFGERLRVTRSKAGVHYSGGSETCYEDEVVRSEMFDRLGRRWRETREQALPAPATVVTTEYTFAPDGKVIRRSRQRTSAGSSEVERDSEESSYDGRGFLGQRVSRAFGDEVIRSHTFAEHDSAGLHHLETRVDPTQPQGVATRRSFDAAQRLVLVTDASDPSKIWKRFEFGRFNTPGDRRLGKLVRAVRHNYHGFTEVLVDETYEYGGIGGRISAKEIRTDDAAGGPGFPARSYRQSAVYDDLGSIDRLTYPSCVECSAGEPPLARTVDYTVEAGQLVAATEQLDGVARTWLERVGYGVDRRPSRILHGNGVEEIIESDVFGHARTKSVDIDTSGSSCAPYCQRVERGPVLYDGEGVVCGIGDESFIHPQTAAKVLEPQAVPCASSHELDPFGMPTGAIKEPGCRPDHPESSFYFDAFDRPVGLAKLAGRRLVQTSQGAQWLSDPASWTRTWTLYGIDGSPLRTVVDSYGGEWQSTEDRILGLGGSIGRQVVRSGGPPIVRHAHRSTLAETDPRGRFREEIDQP